MTEKEIVDMYLQEESMTPIAAKAKISKATIKKILITNGIYPSVRSQRINELQAFGYSIQEICEITKISRKAVLSSLPYTKGRYLVDPRSENALKIEQCRKRKEVAAAFQHKGNTLL